MGSHLLNMKVTITHDRIDCGTRKIIEEVNLDKYYDFELFSLSQVVENMRHKLESEVYLRIHLICNFTFDKVIEITHSIKDELKKRENLLEYNQTKKRNSFLEFLTNFSYKSPIPT